MALIHKATLTPPKLKRVLVRVVEAEVSAVQTLTGRWAGAGPEVLAGILPARSGEL